MAEWTLEGNQNGGHIHWELKGKSESIGCSSPSLIPDIQATVSQMRAVSQNPQRLQDAQRLGNKLFCQLFTGKLQDQMVALAEHPGDNDSLLLCGDEVALSTSVSFSVPEYVSPSFFCQRVPTGVWLESHRRERGVPPLPQNPQAAIIYADDTPDRDNPLRPVVERFSQESIQGPISWMQLPASTRNQLIAKLSITHIALFLGHGGRLTNDTRCFLSVDPHQAGPESARLYGEHLDQAGYQRSCRLIIASSCLAAADAARQDSLAQAFARWGVQHYLAPETDVPRDTALKFAARFLEALSHGVTAGTAHRDAMRGNDSLPLTFFTLFGNPAEIPFPGMTVLRHLETIERRVADRLGPKFWSNTYKRPEKLVWRRCNPPIGAAYGTNKRFGKLADAAEMAPREPRPTIVLSAPAQTGKTIEAFSMLRSGRIATTDASWQAPAAFINLRDLISSCQEEHLSFPTQENEAPQTVRRCLARLAFQSSGKAHQDLLGRLQHVVFDGLNEIPVGDAAACDEIARWLALLPKVLPNAAKWVTCRSDEPQRNERSLLAHPRLEDWWHIGFYYARKPFKQKDLFSWLNDQLRGPSQALLKALQFGGGDDANDLMKTLSLIAVATINLNDRTAPALFGEARRLYSGDIDKRPAWWPTLSQGDGSDQRHEDEQVARILCEHVALVYRPHNGYEIRFWNKRDRDDLIVNALKKGLAGSSAMGLCQAQVTADVLLDHGERPLAQKLLTEWLQRFPEDPILFSLMALTYSTSKDVGCWKEAVRMLDSRCRDAAEQRDPAYVDACGILGGAYKRLGKIDQARWAYRAGWELSAQRNTYNGINAAFIALQQKDKPEAQKIAHQVLALLDPARWSETDGGSPSIRDEWSTLTEAEAYLYLGQLNKAAELYNDAARVYSTKPRVIKRAVEQADAILELLGESRRSSNWVK